MRLAICRYSKGAGLRILTSEGFTADQALASAALESLRGELPEEDQRIVRLRLVLGRAYAALELYPQAERELRAAHWLAREADPVRAARAAEELLGVFAAWGRPERAAEFTRLLEEDAG